MVNRREFLGISLSAGATMVLTPQLLRAFQLESGQLIQRAIPSTGEKLPVIGLSFSNHPGCADHAALKEVLRLFVENGGRVYDAMHVSPSSEDFHISAANELGIQNKLFWSTRATPGNAAPAPDLVKPHIDSLLQRIKVKKIDLVLLPVASDPATIAA